MFENKLVAILNKKIPTGIAINALAHATLGLGAIIDKSLLKLDQYEDSEGNVYPNISQMPFIILRAKSGEIRKTVKTAKERNIAHGIFIDTMTGGTYVEQLENTKNSKEGDLAYYCCVLFGPFEELSNMTKQFSLWQN